MCKKYYSKGKRKKKWKISKNVFPCISMSMYRISLSIARKGVYIWTMKKEAQGKKKEWNALLSYIASSLLPNLFFFLLLFFRICLGHFSRRNQELPKINSLLEFSTWLFVYRFSFFLVTLFCSFFYLFIFSMSFWLIMSNDMHTRTWKTMRRKELNLKINIYLRIKKRVNFWVWHQLQSWDILW